MPCTECSGSSTNCEKCPLDTYLFDNTCLACKQKESNCIACEATEDIFRCLGCLTGFYLENN